MILSVTTILVVTIGMATAINIRFQRMNMEEALKDNVLVISNTVEKSLVSAMLQGKSDEVQKILEAVGSYHNIKEVRIFNPQGVIRKASQASTIGSQVDATTHELFMQGTFRKPIKRTENGVFSVVFPLENKKQCTRCHGNHAKLNGGLAVDISMDQAEAKLKELTRTMIIWAIGMTVVLAVSLSLFLTHFVTNPIHKLIKKMELAEQGLEVRADVTSTDDIGRLGSAFNSLLSKLELAKRKVEKYHYEQMRKAERLASIGELAAGIAHEIKNPLAGIAGVIKVLKKDIPPGDHRAEVMQEVTVQVDRMDKAVKNLLSFARPAEPKMTSVDLNDLIGKLLDFLSPQLASHSIVSERRFASDIPQLSLDPDLVRQAFLNIALNAIQAMPEGGRFLVETNIEKKGAGRTGSIQVSFTDSGRGIPEDQLNKIFNPFFTTRRQGTGLGLSITRKIIEQHDGKITAESPAGAGARFVITFPYQTPA